MREDDKMSNLYLMVTITDRNMARQFMALYESEGIGVSFTALGSGTAVSEVLDYFGAVAKDSYVFRCDARDLEGYPLTA